MGDDLSGSSGRYQEALQYLFARTTGKSKFGLERTRALLAALGNPQERLPCFHVAGTNGKGSVCATLEALLRARGLRTAKYTSPHLVDFRERFVIDGVAVDPAYIVDFITTRTAEVERIGATFFEATTAMAFHYFAESLVDVAIIETGLGGRLDSTNVVRPLVAGVTSIGIDHVEYLGDTREAIAVEKAGIFKPGVVAASGEPDAVIDALLLQLAREHGASRAVSVWRDAPPHNVTVGATGTTFDLEVDGGRRRLHTPLAGAHQASNAALALLMLRAAGAPYWGGWEGAAAALDRVRLPGRFHMAPPYIFDVAHNPDGAAVLASTLRHVAPAAPVAALLCVLEDKDWRGVMSTLAPVVSHFVLTDAPTAPRSRSWCLGDAEAYALAHGWSATAEHDFDRALALARSRGATVLVTGSFHTVGDAMARLQVDPLAG
ncbi:MAG: bifunctional folylpolyglutamate synthase/dihydrofolate synthase [Gemmatimonadaceae bacterium]|nr:bifunctional folylpolyglutamate synthase/dihydrofolate synthase [Gemmatimonadaceae bacterium]